MTSVILTRVDAERNMRYNFRMDLPPDLAGQWCNLRQWCRIAQAAQTRTAPYTSSGAERAALDGARRPKERRGHLSSTVRNT